jgi:DNA-binding XRE family transcriptional regulator
MIGEPVGCTARSFPYPESEPSNAAAAYTSNSPLAGLYDSSTFLVQWDNDLPYHLAQNLVRLRRLREMSQAELAERMGTSQAKIARIEGGEENVTLRTVHKIAAALSGRLTLTLQPSEMRLPRLPNWWDFPAEATTVWSHTPTFNGMLVIEHDAGTTVAARWDTADQTVSVQLPGGTALLTESDVSQALETTTYGVNTVVEPTIALEGPSVNTDSHPTVTVG